MIWFGWVLWDINHYRLFNSESLYTYIINIYDLLCLAFYGISTILGYLMPNISSIYTF